MIDNKSLFPLLLSLIAGFSTLLGAFIVFFTNKRNTKLLAFTLALSAGIMAAISITDLLPCSLYSLVKSLGKPSGTFYSVLFLLIGVFIALLIDFLIPDKSNEPLYKVGLFTTIALMIHNFPEGIATFISGYQDTNLGIYITIAITLHNIPEGISIAVPIYYSTKSKLKALKITFISAAAEPLGAFFSYVILKPYINDIILSICFALIAGIMIFISFKELIPESLSFGYKSLYFAGIIIGILLIPISHIFI